MDDTDPEVEQVMEELFRLDEGVEVDELQGDHLSDDEDDEAINQCTTNRPDRSEEKSILSDEKFIVPKSKILELILQQQCHCGQKVKSDTVVQGPRIAAAINFTYKCKAGHALKWTSSNFYGGKSAISVVLQLVVLLSGLTWEPFALAFKFANIAVGSASNFYRYQRIYNFAVRKFFNNKMCTLLETFKGKELCVAIDVRYDTPGFSANKCTAVFMENETGKIVHVEIGDSREVDRKSSLLEKVTIERGLVHLKEKGIIITEIISDASRSIISLLEKPEYNAIYHSLDVWHKAKKIAQTLGQLSKKAANRDIIPWIKPIVTHFWWCCANCNGDKNRLRSMWVSVLHHITNVHCTPLYICQHDLMSTCDGKKWLTKDSAPYNTIRSFITNKEWLGSLKYYSRSRETSKVENFNSHTLLHYCPKRISFTYDGYLCRNHLAVLDYNHHHDRPLAASKDGELYIQGQLSRKTKEWVAYAKRVNKEFTYVNDLMSECMREGYGISTRTISIDAAQLAPRNFHNPGSKEIYQHKKQRSEASTRDCIESFAETSSVPEDVTDASTDVLSLV